MEFQVGDVLVRKTASPSTATDSSFVTIVAMDSETCDLQYYDGRVLGFNAKVLQIFNLHERPDSSDPNILFKRRHHE